MKFFSCIPLFVVIVGAASCPSTVNKTCTGNNEVISNCGSYCPTTCQSVCKKPVACIDMCKVSDCVCKPGFIRDEVSSKCIEPSNCPKCECPEKNELWIRCNPNCAVDCSSKENPITCMPATPCLPGCICAMGFYRDKASGMCKPFDNCSGYLVGKQ